ncbi:MAG: hypothetical protein FWF00_02825 [Endomicrobia bacterium]|nr:hypothetical protein [Endomicrobiia bacterium]MCL2506554.1 hypothetical protein [Endomicrobiia bacterium]MCL2506609.1 hypothetical protein [Endomicrobiia bacterium]
MPKGKRSLTMACGCKAKKAAPKKKVAAKKVVKKAAPKKKVAAKKVVKKAAPKKKAVAKKK